MVGKTSLGSGVKVCVDAEMAEDLGLYQDDIPEDLVEETLEEVATGEVKRSRKTTLIEPHVDSQAMVQVTYEGLLAESGARDVYMHYGYGPGWAGGGTIPMLEYSRGKWVISVVSMSLDDLNFCFVDGMGNWDNNNGADWSFVPDRILSH